jgi:hypothetical protein
MQIIFWFSLPGDVLQAVIEERGGFRAWWFQSVVVSEPGPLVDICKYSDMIVPARMSSDGWHSSIFVQLRWCCYWPRGYLPAGVSNLELQFLSLSLSFYHRACTSTVDRSLRSSDRECHRGYQLHGMISGGHDSIVP